MEDVITFLAAVPSGMAGLPAWTGNVLSVGGLVSLIVVGLVTSRLWTSSQVDTLKKTHDREVENLKSRYETHIEHTIAAYQGRVDDAVRREEEWREVAKTWQQVAETLSDGLEPLHEQSATTLKLIQDWQQISRNSSNARPGRRQ